MLSEWFRACVRALGFDFRPPSSGRTQPTNQWESLEYKLMVEGALKTLDQIAKIVPGYQGQGYEMAGFGWFQGHKDQGTTKEEYEKNLVNLINDLRKEFKAPKMPAVVATVGFGGYRMADVFRPIWAGQMAVGDPKQHPEFAGTVASVDTRDFWREVENRDRPFSMVVGYKSPHSPRGGRNLPERLRNLYAGEISRPTPNCSVPAIFHKPAPMTGKHASGLAANAVHLDYLRHVAGVDQ